MKKVKYFIEVIVTLALTIGLIYGTEYVLRPFDTDSCIKAVEAFHEMPEDSIDVMIYGSSHAWRGVNTKHMNEKYGIKAYNYGGNWQRLSTEALYFYDSLRTQKPKVVMFETFRITEVISDQDMDGEMYYTRAIPDSPYKRVYLQEAFQDKYDRYISYYFPIVQLHSSWSSINTNNFKNTYTKKKFIENYGYNLVPDDQCNPVYIPDPRNAKQSAINYQAMTVMNEIVLTCLQNDIKVIFFTTPYGYDYEYHDALTEYAKVVGCDYLDFYYLMDDVGIDTNTDFYNEGHLNDQGATKMADYISKYLMEKYGL